MTRTVCPIVRGLTLTAIDTCPDLRTRTARIRLARERGILTVEEAAEKLAIAEALAA